MGRVMQGMTWLREFARNENLEFSFPRPKMLVPTPSGNENGTSIFQPVWRVPARKCGVSIVPHEGASASLRSKHQARNKSALRRPPTGVYDSFLIPIAASFSPGCLLCSGRRSRAPVSSLPFAPLAGLRATAGAVSLTHAAPASGVGPSARCRPVLTPSVPCVRGFGGRTP